MPVPGTRETVEELLRRMGRGEPEQIAELYADGVDWQLDWPAEDHGGSVPWIRDRTDRAGVAEHFALIAAGHVPEHAGAEISGILVDGTEAVVTGVVGNTVRHTGAAYRARFALHLTVVDGRITRYHVYEDSLAVARAYGAA